MSLEQDLRELGRDSFPETPDLAGRVLAELRAAPAAEPMRGRTLPSVRNWRPAIAAGAAVMLLVIGVLAVPAAREAVADWLGIGRVRVEVVPELSVVTAPTSPVEGAPGAQLDLGEPITLEEAQAALTFPVRSVDELGPPDAVYLGDGSVTLAYGPRPGLPEVLDTGVGALLTQFAGEGTPILKQVSVDEEVQPVQVGGEPGLWIEGGPHLVFFEERPGTVVESPGRLAGNTLLWQSGGATFRLEANVDLAAALSVAESVG